MNKIKYLIVFAFISITTQIYSMQLYVGNLNDLQESDFDISSYLNANNSQKDISQETSSETQNTIKVADMLTKLTYLYEKKAQEIFQKISQPNQEISRVQELAYNLGFIKEILGYTNAIIDSIK